MRIAHHPPNACAACYGQYPDRLHIDFEAAWDGPVLEGHGGQVKVAIDDLVICEDCMRAAEALLPDEERDAELEHLRGRNAELEGQLQQKTDLSDKLSAAFAAKAQDKQKAAA